jgi:hypothetical protein
MIAGTLLLVAVAVALSTPLTLDMLGTVVQGYDAFEHHNVALVTA